jgi:hypothetical protein
MIKPDATDTTCATVVRARGLPATAARIAGAEGKPACGCALVWHGNSVEGRCRIGGHAMGGAAATEMKVSRQEDRKE